MFNQNFSIMRKHLLQWMLLLVAFAVPWTTHAQLELTVADGTGTNSYVPVYGYYADAYLRCQIIYPADDLGEMVGGTISGLTFYLSSPAEASWGSANFVIKITEVDATTFTTASFASMADAETVYSGTLNGTQPTMSIEFTTPYTYLGGNLLVEVCNTVIGTYKSATFAGVTATGASVQGYNYSNLDGISATQRNFIPKTTFSYAPGSGFICYKPTGLEVVPTTTTAAFSWIASETAISYEWLYTAASVAQADIDWTTASTTTGTSVNIENLDPSTSYVAYVRSVCGEDDYSGVMRYPFRTQCSFVTVSAANPFEENFNESTFSFECWTNEHIDGPGTSLWQRNSTTGANYIHEGTGSLKLPDMNATTITYLTTPPLSFDAGAINGYEVSFWMYRGTGTKENEGVKVWVNNQPNSTEGGTMLMHICRCIGYGTYTESAAGWYRYSAVIPSSYYGGLAYVVLEGISEYGLTSYLDEFAITARPNCIAPTGLDFENIDSNKVSVTWVPALPTDNTWEVEYSTDGENWTSSGAINSNPYQILNLASKTNYQVRVRTICDPQADDGISAWSGVVSFRTDCGLFTVDNDHSYAENGSQTSTIDCWAQENEGVSWGTNTNGYEGSCFRVQNNTAGNYSTLKSPTLQLMVPSRLKFYYKYNGTGIFSVQVSTDGGATRETLPAVASSEDWTLRSLDLSAYTGSNVNLYLKFETTGGATSEYCYIDELVVEAMPACLEPSDLTVESVTSGDVTLSWVDNNPTNPGAWLVAYGPTATFNLLDETSYETMSAYSTEATVPNLDDYTPYSFAVRASCSPEPSVWSQVVTATTTPNCAPMAPRTFVAGNGTSSTYTYAFYTSSGTTYQYGASWSLFTADELASYDLYEGDVRGFALNYTGTTPFSMPIKIYLANTTSTSQSSATDTMARSSMTLVYDSIYDFVPGWNEIIFNQPFVYTGAGMKVCMMRTALPTPSGTAYNFQYTNVASGRCIYRYSSGATLSSGSNGANRPNMRFVMCVSEPTCMAPLNFAKGALTTTSVTLNWTNRSNAAAWELQVGEASIEITAEDVEMEGDEVSYVLNGLDPNTAYTVKVRSLCSETDMSEWTPTLSFNTLCESITEFPIFYGFETEEGFAAGTSISNCPTTNTLGSCWQNETTVIAPSANQTGRLWATGTDYKHTGSQSLRLPDKGSSSNGVTKTVLAFPPMQFSTTAENGYVISFWLYRPTSFSATTTNYEGFRVYLNNSAEIDANAIDLGLYSRYYNLPYPQEESAAGWYQYQITVRPQDISGTVFMIFEGHCYYSSSTFVDDIRIEEAPSCMPLTELGTGTPDANSVYLSWNEYDSDRPVQYLVEYTAAGAEHPDTARVNYSADMEVDGADNTIAYTLAGLTHNTAYTVRVAAVCTVGDTSEWTPVINFRTACDAFDLPYAMTFETNDVNSATTLPWCWTRYNSADESYPKVVSGNAKTGSRSLQYSVRAGGATAEVAILPQISAEYAATANRMVIFVKGQSNLDSALTIGVMTDPTDYTTFTEVAHINATTAYTKHKINLPVGAVYVAIRGNRPTSGTQPINIFVDDVTIEGQPSCDQPEGFTRKGTATSTAVPLAWIDGEGSAWEIERTYTPAEGDPVVETILVSANDVVRGTVDADSVYYTLMGLSPRTAYSLQLRTVCDNENSAWADATVSFTSQNNETDITAFNLNGQYSADIDSLQHTVIVTMPYGTDLTALGGNFTMSQGATADTNGGNFPTTIASATDFSQPLTITVKAQDNALSQTWIITVVNELCARPTQLAVSNVEKYSFVLSVTPNAASENVNFQLVYSNVELDDAALSAAEKIDFEYDPEEADTITHLNRGTTYYVYVRANCGDLFSEWATTSVTTIDLVDCVTVANGTATSQYFPLYGGYMDGDNHSQTIYPASQLTSLVGQTIQSMKYYVSEGSSSFVSEYDGQTYGWEHIPVTVKLMTTTTSSVSSAFVETSNATTVYNGTLTANVADGMTITFDHPFVYTGGNLVVEFTTVSDNGEYSYSSCNFQGTSVGSSRLVFDNNYAGTGDETQTATFRPKVTFCFGSEACPAPVADTVVLTGPGTNTAIASWLPSTGDFANTYDVRVVTAGSTDFENAAFSANDIEVTANEQGLMTTALSGLTPFTEYDFYVHARCNADGYDDGYSEWSNPIHFKTNSNCRVPEQIVAEPISKTAAIFSWVNGSNENGQPTQDNNFQYCVSNTPLNEVNYTDEDEITGNNENGTASVTVNNLQPGNTYYFYVANYCELEGLSPYTSYTLEMPVPCVAPTNINAAELGKYNATITWDGDPYEDSVTYEIYYDTMEVEDFTSLIGNIDDIAVDTAKLTMLQRNTTYYVYVRTSCPVYGASDWSEVYSFTTLDLGYDCETAGGELAVGNGTSTSYGPICGFYGYERNAYIFTPADGLTPGSINSLSWNYSSSSSNTIPVKIYLKNTTESTFGATSTLVWNNMIADATLVYDETVTISSGWNKFDITGFEYTGGNLMVLVASNRTGSGGASVNAYLTATGSNNHAYARIDNTYDDNNAFSSWSSKAVDNQRHNIKFGLCGIMPACPTMEAPTANNVTNNSAIISWPASIADHVASYELIIAAENEVTDFTNVNAISDIEDTFYVVEGLEPNTDYFVYVRTNCNVDPYEDGWSNWSAAGMFRTQSNCFRPSGFMAESVTSNSATLIWHRGNADVEAWNIWDGQNAYYDVTLADVVVFGENNDSVRFTLTGLTADTNYDLQVMSNCMLQDNGVSDYAEEHAVFHTLSAATAITAFTVSPYYPAGFQMDTAVINDANSTVELTVMAGTDITALTPFFATSAYVSRVEIAGDTVVSGDSVDFTAPVVFRVYAQDTNIYRDWTVTVAVESCATANHLSAQTTRISADLTWNIGDATVENFDLIVSDTTVTDFAAWAAEQHIQTINVAGEGMTRNYTLTGLDRGDTIYVYLKNACTVDWTLAQYLRVVTKKLGYYNCTAEGTTFTVGDSNSTTTAYLLYTSYGNTYSQHIYTAADLAAAGVEAGSIRSIAFLYTGTSSTYDKTQSVYIGTTTNSAFASSGADAFVPADEMTLVYGPTLNSYQAGWRVYEFDEPFEWDGSANIVVGMLSNSTATSALGWSVRGSTAGANRTIYRYRDSNPIDITDLSSVDYGSSSSTRPVIKFNFCGEEFGCAVIANATIDSLGTETATLKWSASESDYLTGYEIVLSETPITDFEGVQPTFTTNADVTSYDFENLVAYTNYYVYVRANCELDSAHNDGTSEWVMVTFRTNSVCHTADNLTVTMTDRNAAHFTWTNDQNSPAQYVLSTTMLDEAALAQAEFVDLAATNEFDTTGLDFETPYFFYVRHNCGDEGESPWQMVSFVTGPECPWVVDAEATAYFNAAVIDWTDGEFSAATSWRLVLTSLDENQEPVTAFDQVVNSHPYTVLGLNSETTYEVELYALCGEAESEVYNDLSFTTPTTPGDCITVAEGTGTTTNAPIYGLWMDDPQGTQSLYPASMLTNVIGQEILSLHYHVTDPGTNNMGSNKSMKVWMQEVTEADLAAGFHSIANATLVYDGTVSQSDFSIAGGFTVTLDEPFIYNGGNLLIAFQNNEEDSGSYCTITFAADSADNGSRYGYGASNYNFTGTGTVSHFLPTVDFCVVPPDCHAVRSLANSNVTSNSAEVSWLPGGSELQWNMVVSNTALDSTALAAAQSTVLTTVNQSLTNLTVDADYYVYVRPVCDATEGIYDKWAMTHFVTAPTCSAPVTALAMAGDNQTVTFIVSAGENGTPESYTYEYWVVGDEENVTTATTMDTSWTLTLAGGQNYGWHVRANCGDTDGNSRWTDGNEFYVCGTIAVTVDNPYVEDFSMEDRVSCWTLGNNGLATTDENYGSWYVATLSGVLHFVYYNFEATSTHWATEGDAILMSPAIELPNDGHAILSFREYIYNAANYQGKVYVLPEGTTEPVEPIYAPAATEMSNGYFTRTLDLNAYLGQTFRVIFKYEGENGCSWGINNFVVAMSPAFDVTAIVAETDDERGTVAIAGDTNTAGKYFANTGATLTATANEGYEFVYWSNANGDTVSNEAELTVYPTSDTVLTANFDTLSHTLNVYVASTDANMGSVTLDGVAPVNGQNGVSMTVKYMTEHTLTANANEHYMFSHWGDLAETDADYANATRTVTMPNANLSIRAYFTAETIDSTRTEDVCDAFVLRRSDNSVVETYTTSGTYEKTFDDPGAGGRIHLTLNLTVRHSSSTGFRPEPQCDSYTWTRTDGTTQTFTESANGLTYAYTSTENCPSTDTLYLTINTSNEETVEAQMGCDSYRYTFTGGAQSTEVFTASTNDAVVYTTTVAGCDSTIHFALTINASTENTTTVTACDEYTWSVNGQTYTTVGDNTDQVVTTNLAGCPHTENLQLTIVSSEGLGSDTTITVCDSLLWHGQYRTVTDDYTYTYSVGACTGTDVLHLTVNNSTHTSTTADVCDTYTWNRADGEELVYTASTEQVYLYENLAGCASSDSLHLTIRHSTSTRFNEGACDSYTWTRGDGTSVVFTESVTDELYSYTSLEGCASTDTLTLSIGTGSHSKEIVESCGDYTWERNGQTYSTSGNKYYNNTTPEGCLIRDTLVLTVKTLGLYTDVVVACDSAEWHGTWYYASTNTPTYTIEAGAANGCDSIVTLNLTVSPSYNLVNNVVTCNAYEWNGTTYHESTTQSASFTSINNCDSTVTLNLTISDVIGSEIYDTACNSYAWHGHIYTESADPTYTIAGGASTGCDSTVTLHLTINYPQSGEISETACESYDWYGTTYTTSGDRSHTLTAGAANGCDSIVTLHLTINHAQMGQTNAEACDSLVWYGETYTTSGDYNHTITAGAANGCDSIVTLTLTIKPSYTVVDNQTACGSYTWNGNTYTESTMQNATFTALNGCDSTVTLNLTISDAITTDLYETACDSYEWNGQTYTASTVDVDSLTSIGGCDSIVTLHLTINNSYNVSAVDSACDSYTWNGNIYTESAILVDTLAAANSCDSIVTLSLTINNSESNNTVVSSCVSYTWAVTGQTYSQSGVQTYHGFTPAGCDIFDTLTLTILEPTTGTAFDTACDSYTWHGNTYTESTVLIDTLVGSNLCDSVVTLTLTINYSESFRDTVNSCGPYTWAVNNHTYNQTGMKTYRGTTPEGCDIRDTLVLTINQTYNIAVTDTACDSYTWNGTTYTESTVYNDTLQSVNGCDSIVNINLTINYSESFRDTVNSCGPYTWAVNGHTYNQTGVKTYRGTTPEGCDIRDTLVLTINQTYNFAVTDTACDSYTWNGVTYTETTLYNDTLVSVNGCDSIVNINLTINYSERSHEYVTNCGPYTWEVNGRTYNQTGVKTYRGTTPEGCDIRDTLTLTILETYNTNINETACDSYTWYGNSYYESAELTHTLAALNGCDSVVTLNLTINYSTEEDVTVTIDPSELPYTFAGENFEAFGQYDVVITNVAGCDSTIHLTLNQNDGIETADVLALVKVYPNPTTGYVQISAEQIDKVEVLDLVGRRVALFENTNTFDLSNLAAGTYTLRITVPEGTTLRKVVKR